MPVFAYKGLTTEGRSTRGFVDADTSRSARTKLRRDGIFITEIGESTEAHTGKRESLSDTLGRLRRISPSDLSLATRQLATLVGAGVPLVDSLGALTEQVEHGRLKGVLGQIRDRVNEGASLADAIAQSGAFPDLYVGLVRAGEAAGALEHVLVRLADYLEDQVRLRNKVSAIMIYPAVMFFFAIGVVIALVTWVLPQITELLASLNRPLPFHTRLVMGTSDFLREFWWLILALGVGAAFLFRAVLRTERGHLAWDRLRLRTPIVGRIVRQLSIARFTRTLATLLSGGIPIVRALEISKQVANNRVLGLAIDAAKENVTEGASLARPLRTSGEFPPLVVHMVDVGERSGELEAMLEKVAQTYDEQVETSITRLTALLEPLLILIMVGLVLTIILATLGPLLDLTSSL